MEKGVGRGVAAPTMSVIEELSMGTRIAWPFSLPFNSGKTSATAVADPVEVGAKFSLKGWEWNGGGMEMGQG